MNKKTNEKGITLVALVITIVVLIILASVTISLILNEDGVINKAIRGKENYEWASNEERQSITNVESRVNELTLSNSQNPEEDPPAPVVVQKTTDDLNEGEYIIYIDKNNQPLRCIVLYNNDDYGIQIITEDSLGAVELGNGSGQSSSVSKTSNLTYYNNAFNDYDNAITILNTEAEKYLNTATATDARCVGSLPNNKNNKCTTTVYGDTICDVDWNFKPDDTQMNSSNLNILKANNNKEYWMAARGYSISASSAWGTCTMVGSSGSRDSKSIISISRKSGTDSYSYSTTYGIRPVFTLKSGLNLKTGGLGTSESPYEFE